MHAVTNGSLQGYVFMLETLLSPGDLVAVEAPTYDRALLQLRLHGMGVLPIPVEAFAQAVRAVSASALSASRGFTSSIYQSQNSPQKKS